MYIPFGGAIINPNRYDFEKHNSKTIQGELVWAIKTIKKNNFQLQEDFPSEESRDRAWEYILDCLFNKPSVR